jgi:LPXTG-motif cell wall-anchored protein
LKESLQTFVAAVAVVFCCALPLLVLSGAFAAGGGLALNQQALFAFGLAVLLLGGLAWVLLKRRN